MKKAIVAIGITVTGLAFALDDVKQHGNCVVATNKDYFSDRVTGHILICGDAETATPSLSVSCLSSRVVRVAVSDGGRYPGEDVPIKCRFTGDDAYYKGRWEGFGSRIQTENRLTAKDVLDGIERTTGFMFQIGNNVVQEVDFGVGGLQAVEDLRSRCSYWLDLEPYRRAEELASCFPECDWEDLRGIDFSRAELFGGKFENADLSGADFSHSTTVTPLGHATIRLTGADLRGANLTEANFRSASLSAANLDGANLQRAYLGSAFMLNASLRGTDLTEADLSNANLLGADLTDARLYGANLDGVYGCDISGRLVGCNQLLGEGNDWRAVPTYSELTGEP